MLTKQENNDMTTLHQNETTHESADRPRDTLASYFARYRFALYLLSGVGIGAGIMLSGSSPAVLKLLPILVFLPCIAMLFMPMKHGTEAPTEPVAEPTKVLPFQSGKRLDPQQ
jgi:hypothetical protein